MTLAIHRLMAEGSPGQEAINRFLATQERFPIVEGPSVTFVYHGHADQVLLQHFIYGIPTSQPFHRIDGSDLWHLTLELRRRSRVQYKLNVIHGDEHNWILDPLNPEKAFDPFGANSVCHSEGSERPEWTHPDPEVRPGTLEDFPIRSKALGGERRVRVYLPARYRLSRRYPLLLVHDGSDYERYSAFKTVLDNLIHRLEIAPMLVALTDPGERLEEYPDNPAHAHFLRKELTPRLIDAYQVLDEPHARGLMGASFGAVASLACAWRYPGYYGRLLLQSGSFAFTDIGTHHRGPTFDPVVRFVNEFRDDPGKPSEKVYVSCGLYESLIYENRSLVPLLKETGMDVRFVEVRDGHNWENWRDRLRKALSWLFPGPLWMVYE